MPSVSPLTLSQLRTLVRQESDTENDPHVSDAEVDQYVNLSAAELYGTLVQKFGGDYYTTASAPFTTNGSSSLYPLPADFFKLAGVDIQIGTSGTLASSPAWLTMQPFMFADRNRYTFPNYQTLFGLTNLRYRLMGPSQIMFTPLPASGQVLRIWYHPRMPLLAQDADTFDGINGWEEMVVVDAAIKVVQKQERDASLLLARKAALEKRVEEEAENRNAGDPQVVSETQPDGFWGWPGGTYWPGGGYPA